MPFFLPYVECTPDGRNGAPYFTCVANEFVKRGRYPLFPFFLGRPRGRACNTRPLLKCSVPFLY
jgi:hypothetical protein